MIIKKYLLASLLIPTLMIGCSDSDSPNTSEAEEGANQEDTIEGEDADDDASPDEVPPTGEQQPTDAVVTPTGEEELVEEEPDEAEPEEVEPEEVVGAGLQGPAPFEVDPTVASAAAAAIGDVDCNFTLPCTWTDEEEIHEITITEVRDGDGIFFTATSIRDSSIDFVMGREGVNHSVLLSDGRSLSSLSLSAIEDTVDGSSINDIGLVAAAPRELKFSAVPQARLHRSITRFQSVFVELDIRVFKPAFRNIPISDATADPVFQPEIGTLGEPGQPVDCQGVDICTWQSADGEHTATMYSGGWNFIDGVVANFVQRSTVDTRMERPGLAEYTANDGLSFSDSLRPGSRINGVRSVIGIADNIIGAGPLRSTNIRPAGTPSFFYLSPRGLNPETSLTLTETSYPITITDTVTDGVFDRDQEFTLNPTFLNLPAFPDI